MQAAPVETTPLAPAGFPRPLPLPRARARALEAAPEPPTDAERTRRIREAVRARSQELRASHPWLARHQSAIGLTIQMTAVAGFAASGVLYATGVIGAWLAIPVAAFFASIVHEIEHDLIHKCYFPRHPRIVTALLALGWLVRPSTIAPWVRRPLHLLHHKVSGTAADIEERAITNGDAMSLRRLLIMVDGLVIGSLLRRVPTGMRGALVKRLAAAYFPLGFVHYGLLYAFLALHLGAALATGLGVPVTPGPVLSQVAAIVDLLFIVWIAPNVLRTFALHFISSNMHYFGDIEEGNVLVQTQVLNRWYFLPLQLFCFNFGSTHPIHHIYVPDPFYLRQLTAPVAHGAMRANGVRFNDVGSMWRANRYGLGAEA